tara:strand:+ start:762 stop:1010 length:249 start_codon:yes stop_codon:yes gene_type:complete
MGKILNFDIHATHWLRRRIRRPIEGVLNRFDFHITHQYTEAVFNSGIYTRLQVDVKCTPEEAEEVKKRVHRMLKKYGALANA